jgi:biopolymer transport protein ExbD
MATPSGIDSEIRAELNVTPLVDVMLVLLVIFMTMAPHLTRETPIELPSASQPHASDAAGRTVLRIHADGALVLDGVAVPREQLAERLRAMSAGGGGVLLEADRSIAHGIVVEILDLCRAAGVTAVGIVTQGGTAGPTRSS